MANDQIDNAAPQPVEHNRNHRADQGNNAGSPDQRTQAGKSDPTIARNAAPSTDDSVVEAIDETTPGVSQPVDATRSKTPRADKVA